MKEEGQISNSNLFTRRKAATIAGMALASGTILSTMASAQPLPAGKSVFEDSCMPGSAGKYGSGDKPIIYGLVSFWLMLTTDNWKACIEKDGWLKGLAAELGADAGDLSDLWDIYNNHADAFKEIQDAFINYTSDLNVYGRPPCPGGKTITQIAGLASQNKAKR